MTPLLSWIVIVGLALTVFLSMNALYIDSLKNDKDNN